MRPLSRPPLTFRRGAARLRRAPTRPDPVIVQPQPQSQSKSQQPPGRDWRRIESFGDTIMKPVLGVNFWKYFIGLSIAACAVPAFLGWYRGDKWDDLELKRRRIARARIEKALEERRKKQMQEKETVEAKDLGAGET